MASSISIVTTLYKSAPYIYEFYERISTVVKKINENYTIIFVNDGSPDSSLDIVLDIHRKDKKVVVVELSRNFGHHAAIMEGLAVAQGKDVFLIDCDLEEAPELLSDFYVLKKKYDCEVVYGVVESRSKGFMIDKLSEYALNIYKKLSGIESPKNQATIRLMSKEYVHSLLRFSERELFLEGLFYLTGYKQIPVSIKKNYKNTSSYTLSNRASLLVTALCSFSNKPLLYTFYVGFIIFLVSFFFSICLLIKKFFLGHVVSGWTSVVVSTWLLGGVIVCCLGIIALYLSKMFSEIKGRPRAIIKAIYASNNVKRERKN